MNAPATGPIARAAVLAYLRNDVERLSAERAAVELKLSQAKDAAHALEKEWHDLNQQIQGLCLYIDGEPDTPF